MGQEPRNAGAAVRSLTWLAVLAIGLGSASMAQAQIRLVSAKKANGNGEPPAEPAYVDRVIEGLAAEAKEEREAIEFDREGWPRFLRLETRLGTLPYEGDKRSLGFTASGAIETPSHGTISVDASVATDDGRSSITLRQRQVPMADGWMANAELGVITPMPPSIMRAPSRVFVPGDFIRGAAADWGNRDLGVQWHASTGTLGRLDGFPVAGFEAQHGEITTVGVQKQAGHWVAAARHSHGVGIARTDRASRARDLIDADSTQVAVRHEREGNSVQANAVLARSSETDDMRRGVWVDGETKVGTSQYGWGYFRMDPKLSWSGQGMIADIEGAYARGAWRKRQWSAESTVDVMRSVSGPDDSGVLVTGTGRYRMSRTLTLGTGGAFRTYQGNAGNLFTDVRVQNAYGLTGVRAEYANGSGRRHWRLGVDQSWTLPQGWSLGTSVFGGRETGKDAGGSLWGAAVSFAAPVASDVLLTGNASVDARGNGTRSSSANVNLSWRLSPRWSLEGNFIYSHGRFDQAVSIDPLAPPPDPLFASADTRSFFIVLRYEDRAGTPTAPLGGTPRTGGGAIEGVVFLDANRTGTQEAGETGASGVTVYLDGRYAVRTDSQGRFSFPFVAPGPRVITVLNETLPLPWEAGERAQTRIEVIVRETARVSIPVIRRGPE